VPASLAAVGLLRLVAYGLLARGRFPPAGRWLRGDAILEVVVLALPLGAAAIVSTLNAQIDRYVVGRLLGAAAFAEYGIGSIEVPLVPLVPYAVGATLAPHYVRLYAEGRRDDLLALWHAAVRKTTLVVVPLATLFLAMAEEVVEIVAGPAYARAAIPFRLYTLLLLHRVADFGALMQATGDSRTILLASLIALAGNALLTYPATAGLGYAGAAAATVVATVPAIAFFWARLCRRLGVPFRRLLPWRFTFATLALSAAAAALARFASLGLGSAPLRLAAASLVFVAVTVAAGRAARLLSKEDLAYARRWLTLGFLRGDPP
jgi:O-antigen/teichoic acid export membrane protein